MVLWPGWSVLSCHGNYWWNVWEELCQNVLHGVYSKQMVRLHPGEQNLGMKEVGGGGGGGGHLGSHGFETEARHDEGTDPG